MPAVLRAWTTGLAAFGAAGIILIVLAWAQTRDTVAVDDQISWAAVGLAGATVVGLASLGALTLERRAVEGRLRRVGSTLANHLARSAPAAPTTLASAQVRVVGTSMRHYHRPECAMVAGKPSRAASVDAHRQAGLRPCGVCEA